MPEAEHAILLVDDEASIRSALQRLFRRAGYAVLTADGGRQALEALAGAAGNVSLIISDQRMPGMDGVRFLEQARALVPDAARFLLTGYADVEAVADSVNRGGIARYVAKPWNDQELLLQVRQAVEQVALKRENRRLLDLTQAQNRELQEFNRRLEEKVAERTRTIEAQNEALEQNLTSTVRAFASLLGVNTPILAEHGRRVGQWSRKMADALALPAAEAEDIEMAGLLHDVAKIGYPRKMLENQTRLWTPEDAARYRLHPVEGQQAVQFIDRLARVGELIRAHHERCDGQGFPDGLAGNAIPLGSRIIAVADAYDRIAHLAEEEARRVREYLQAGRAKAGLAAERLRHEAALFYLEQRAGARFDPDLPACFREVCASGAGLAGPAAAEVALAELQPGMRLSRDLYSTKGAFLLSRGTVISPLLVAKLRELHGRNLCTPTIPIVPEDRPASERSAPC